MVCMSFRRNLIFSLRPHRHACTRSHSSLFRAQTHSHTRRQKLCITAQTKIFITTNTITEKLRLHKQLAYTSAYDCAPTYAARGTGCIDILFVLTQEAAQCACGPESTAALFLSICAAPLGSSHCGGRFN